MSRRQIPTPAALIIPEGDQIRFRAVRRMQGMLTTLTGFARALSNNPRMIVVISRQNRNATLGDTIELAVPLALGRMVQHDRLNCGRRDPDSSALHCPACSQDDEVYSVLFHELAHQIFGTFEAITQADKDNYIAQAIRSVPTTPGSRIAKLTDIINAVNNGYQANHMGIATFISPYLPTIINALEDARVNRAMYAVRSGTYHMFRAMAHRAFVGGSEQSDGTVLTWRDRQENDQAVIGTFCIASGFPYKDVFHPDVEDALDDPKLHSIIDKFATARGITAIYRMSFPVLERLRELGFCIHPDDMEDDAPPPPSMNKDPQPSDEKEPGDGTPTDGDDGADGESDDSSTDGDDHGDDTGSDDESDDTESGDDGSESDDGDDDDDVSDSAGDRDADSDSDVEPDDEQSGSGSADGEESDDGSDGDSSSDNESGSATGLDGSDSASPAQPDQTGAVTGASQSEDGLQGSDTQDGAPETQDYVDKYVIGPHGVSAVEQEKRERRMNEDPDEVQKALEQFGGHSESSKPDDYRANQAMIDAIKQADSFDAPSTTVSGVRVNTYKDSGRYWGGGARPENFTAIDGATGSTLLRLRTVLADNKKSRNELGLRRGRPTSHQLHTVPTGNKDVFNRTTIPHKKDYFVCVMLDVSSSTGASVEGESGVRRIHQIKQMGMTLGDLLHRAGVKFAIYAHSGSGGGDIGRYGGSMVDIMPIKEEGEPWSEAARNRMANINCGGSNLDGHALEFARKRIEKSTATDTIIVYCTDGAMPEANYSDEVVVLLREILTIAKNPKMNLVGVGMGTDSPNQYGLPTVEVNRSSDIDQIIKFMGKMLGVGK